MAGEGAVKKRADPAGSPFVPERSPLACAAKEGAYRSRPLPDRGINAAQPYRSARARRAPAVR